jgi:hypothetical protein
MLFIPINATELLLTIKRVITKLKKFLWINEVVDLKRTPVSGLETSVRILFFVGFMIDFIIYYEITFTFCYNLFSYS